MQHRMQHRFGRYVFIFGVLCAMAGSPLKAQQVTPADAERFSGHWRGVLKFSADYGITLGLELKPTAQGWQLLLTSPNQTSAPLEPTEFSLKDNQLRFRDDTLKASFSGTFAGDTLTGSFEQRQTVALTLQRLTGADEKRLAHEQRWFGDLQLSQSASLPLVLNVAVIANGYHVTLDSPKQQSFGIPVDGFSQTDSSLQFRSDVIKASYQGSWQQDEWQGTFVQGMAMPLNLKKKPVAIP